MITLAITAALCVLIYGTVIAVLVAGIDAAIEWHLRRQRRPRVVDGVANGWITETVR